MRINRLNHIIGRPSHVGALNLFGRLLEQQRRGFANHGATHAHLFAQHNIAAHLGLSRFADGSVIRDSVIPAAIQMSGKLSPEHQKIVDQKSNTDQPGRYTYYTDDSGILRSTDHYPRVNGNPQLDPQQQAKIDSAAKEIVDYTKANWPTKNSPNR